MNSAGKSCSGRPARAAAPVCGSIPEQDAVRRLVYFCWIFALPPSALPQAEFFEARIRPVLVASCYSCHDANKATGGLNLASKAGMERGGSRGTAIRPGDPDASLLYRAVSYRDPALKMPPG